MYIRRCSTCLYFIPFFKGNTICSYCSHISSGLVCYSDIACSSYISFLTPSLPEFDFLQLTLF